LQAERFLPTAVTNGAIARSPREVITYLTKEDRAPCLKGWRLWAAFGVRRDLWQLSGWAAHALRRIRRKRARLICVFWHQAELW
jgi:hypothetical protein